MEKDLVTSSLMVSGLLGSIEVTAAADLEIEFQQLLEIPLLSRQKDRDQKTRQSRGLARGGHGRWDRISGGGCSGAMTRDWAARNEPPSARQPWFLGRQQAEKMNQAQRDATVRRRSRGRVCAVRSFRSTIP